MTAGDTIPKNPVPLPGTFWGITTFFNPAGYRNKSENYRIFRESSKKQGLKLLALELAFGKRPFELGTEDADILIQLRTKKENILWQKEAMLNIGLKNLPPDCDKFIWLDCDIIFKNDGWISETSALLERYSLVQPFRYFIKLPKGKRDLGSREINELICREKKGDNTSMKDIENKSKIKSHIDPNARGIWAARREILDTIHFFDYAIVGSGDTFMFYGFTNFNPITLTQLDFYPGTFRHKYLKWYEIAVKEIKGSVYVSEGYVLHLWHGKIKNREYLGRHKRICEANYNPDTDIKKDEQGLWVWTGKNKVLQRVVRRYFVKRNEEDSLVFTLYLFPNRFYREYANFFGPKLKQNYPELYSSYHKILKTVKRIRMI